MKLLNISNWFQSLVESFTFYGGAPSSGGGAMGGGRPFNPMQGGRFGNMNPYVSPMAQQQGSPMQSQPTPDMLNNIRMKLQGMGRPAPLPQGQPMQSQPTQGGLFGNMGAYISPVAKG